MIVLPKDTPIIVELNSYYLDIEKLFLYYQGIVDAGCAHFQLPSAEGVVFFDAFNLINGTYREWDSEKDSVIKGTEAISRLFDEARAKKILISLYEIPPEQLEFWANVANGEDLYKNLSTEFTDLEGLVRKMLADRFTGYIEVTFQAGDIAVLYLQNGRVIGSESAAGNRKLVRTEKIQQDLIERSRKEGAILNVRRILLDHGVNNGLARSNRNEAMPERPKGPAAQQVAAPDSGALAAKVEKKPLNIREMLQYLMLIYEKFISSNRKIRGEFDTILKRKFVEKVDKYEFLDPFADEFKYADGKIEFSGRVDDMRLATGLLECLKEIAAENDMQTWLDKSIRPLREKFAAEIEALQIRI